MNRKLWLAVALCAVCTAPLMAQIRSGAITGSVTDKSNAVVPEAQVLVLNELTNVTVSTKSNAAGEYTVPYLPSGVYTVAVDKPGFAAFKKTGIALGTGEGARVDARLDISSTNTTVEVRASEVMLQTESTTVQNQVGAESIDALPDINHNPYYFAALQPNVVGNDEMLDTTSANSFGIGYNARASMSALSINGGLAFGGSYMVDGVAVQGSGWNEASVLPNQSGIQEVQTIVNNYSAEYGRGQGVVNIVTKGGTNRYHGQVYDRLRNEALNANTFANNAQGISRGPFKVNTFGGSLGGPIKKDKLFFFGSYEGMKHSDGLDYLFTVPTPAQRRGDFSQTVVNVNTKPTPVQLFNPFSVTQAGTNLYQRAPYPNAIITNPDPATLKLYSNYPDPNRTPIDAYNTQNYYNRVIRTFDRNNVSGRLDYYRGKQSIYGAAGIQLGDVDTPGPWGSGNAYYAPYGGTAQPSAPVRKDNNPYISLGDTVTFSPTMVGDFRLGIHRVNMQLHFPINSNFDYNALGIPAAIQDIFAVPGTAPDVNITPWTQLNQSISAHKHEHQTNSFLTANMTKMRGKWTLKWGAEYRLYLSNYQDPEEGSVMIDSGRGTNRCPSGACGSTFTAEYTDSQGNSVSQNSNATLAGVTAADLLAGAGSLMIAPGRNIFPAFAQKYFALYTQNDWRATSRLTLFLGLRWDLQPGTTERYNRMSALDLSQAGPFGSPGVVAFPGTAGYNRNLWDTHYRDFGPRFGVAYKAARGLVVRGGYGVSYLPSNTGYFDGTFNYGSGPFASSTNQLPYGGSPQGIPVGTWHDPAVSQVVHPVGSNPSAPQNYGSNRNLFPRHGYLDGRAQQWNVVIERTLGSTWLVSATYTGVKGDHLQVARLPITDITLVSPAILSCYRNGTGCPANDSAVTGNGYVQTGTDPGTAQVPNPFNPNGTLPFQGILAQKTVPRWLLDSLYPLFPGQTQSFSEGFQSYHSGTAQVNHRMAGGLQFTAFYTWSKSLGVTSSDAAGDQSSNGIGADRPPNYQNIRPYKHLLFTDIPHRLVIRGVYELPLGRGKRFNSSFRPLQWVESGWRVAGVQLLQSGYPVKISGGAGGSMNAMPNRVPGEPLEVPKALQRWYDGKTSVTLPDGRAFTPCAQCFLEYNPDAFAGQVIHNPKNASGYLADNYWWGNSAPDYSGIRSPGKNSLNLSLSRTFRVRERYAVDFQASSTNLVNHAQFRNITGVLGSINVTPPSNPSATQLGQLGPGSFGTHGLTTFDPRQIELQLRVQF